MVPLKEHLLTIIGPLGGVNARIARDRQSKNDRCPFFYLGKGRL